MCFYRRILIVFVVVVWFFFSTLSEQCASMHTQTASIIWIMNRKYFQWQSKSRFRWFSINLNCNCIYLCVCVHVHVLVWCMHVRSINGKQELILTFIYRQMLQILIASGLHTQRPNVHAKRFRHDLALENESKKGLFSSFFLRFALFFFK